MDIIKSQFQSAVSIVVAATLLCATGAAWSQAAPGPAGAQASASADEELQEIVVTAQRHSEDIQQAPLAITSISAQQLLNANLVRLDDIQLVTPGLVFSSGNNYSQPYIRGVGTNLPTEGLEGAVATYIDGAYQQRTEGSLTDLLDVSSVQVLKGPQGTLWGRNASGGAIVITTADPTNETSANVAAEYGRFNHVLGEGVFNAPIDDTLAVRVAFRHSDQDGYVTNLTGGSDLGYLRNDDARVKLRWAPSDSFSAVLAGEYIRDVNGLNVYAIRGPESTCVPCLASGGAFAPVEGFYQTDQNTTEPYVNLSRSLNLRLHYDSEVLDVQSTTAYKVQSEDVTAGNDYSTLSLEDFKAHSGGETFSQEVLVSTKSSGWLNGLFGASYLQDNASFDALIFGGPGSAFAGLLDAFGQYPNTLNTLDTKSASAFLEGYLTPIDRLKITLGGRYTHDNRSFNVADNLAGSAVGGAPGTVINQNASTDSNAFTPRVVFAYDLKPVNLYVSWNRGYKSGGFSEPDFNVLPIYTVKPEFINSYEAGAKYVSEDRRVRANADVFYYDYTNIQVSYYATINGVATPLTENAASARGDGLELDGSFAASSWLSLLGGFDYLHAYFTSYPAGAVVVPAPATPCAGPVSPTCPYPGAVSGSGIPGALGGYTQNLAGSPLTRSPRYSYYVGGTLKAPIGASWQANFNAILHYSGDYDFYPDRGGPLGLDYQPAFTIVNLTTNIGPQNERFSAGIYVNNLTNTEYYVTHQTTEPFGIATAPAPPRTYGLRLTAKF